MLSQRQRAILATLIESGDFVAVGELARQQGVTDRTVRLDLAAIEAYLAGTPHRLERHKRRRVRLRLPPEERPAWLERLRPMADVAYRLSAEERQQAILAALLRRTTPLSLGRLADELFVSRRTVVEDLKRVEGWLRDRGLRLVRLPTGVKVEGPEGAWRAALAELISPGPGEAARRHPAASFPLLPPEEMAAIREAVTRAAEALPYELADSAYEGLVYHLAVAILRLRAGHDIAMDPEELADLAERPEWEVAGRLAADLEERLGVPIPPGERGYITLHLLGAKAIDRRTRPDDAAQDAPLAEAVDAFIRAAGAHLGVDLTGDDDLVRGLILHLRPAVWRLRYGLRLVNPLRDQIMERYGFLMAAVKAAAPALEERLGIHITGDELAYLAMHVGAHLERVSARRPPRVLLVCGSGIGTA
ncbi:MAG: transcription antiterminator, partial [Bacillota bacterium]